MLIRLLTRLVTRADRARLPEDAPLGDDARLIVGLGNPGPRYDGTRHNIGFAVMDAFAEAHGLSSKAEGRMKADVYRGRVKGQALLLAKPTTFMNLSGQSVVALTQFYKLPWSSVLILVDDVDLPFGRLRFRPSGSAGTHNGLKSIVAESGTQAFSRLRIGVGGAPEGWDLADYVLAKFSPDEQAQLPKLLAVCNEALGFWLQSGTEAAMNRYNAFTLAEPAHE